MATHDYVIANQSGAAFRTDLNNALAAIVSNNSNSSEPSTKYAYQWWADTSAAVMKIRNSANDGWIELFQLDGTLTLEDGSAASPALAFRDDLNTGIFSAAADTFDISTGGTGRIQITNSGMSINDNGDDFDVRIEGANVANLVRLDAANDRVGIGTDAPQNDFHLISGNTDLFKLESNNAGSTGAVLMLFHSTASPADNDIVGTLRFRGRDSGGNETDFADIRGNALDVTDGTEDGELIFNTVAAGGFGEKMRLNPGGRLLLGTSTTVNVGAPVGALYQIETTSQNAISCVAHRGTGNSSGSILILAKSRGTAAGSATAVADDDELGAIRFAGADGTDLESRGGEINCVVDGTPGGNDMPGRLQFKTTADGASTATTRMTINSSGGVGIGLTDIAGFGGTYKGIDVGHKGSGLAGRTDNVTIDLRSNTFYDGSNHKYGGTTTTAGQLSVGGAQLSFKNAPSGTAGATATLTERLNIGNNGALYLRSGDTSNASQTLKKNVSGADNIDYLQCRDSSNALKMKIGGNGGISNFQSNDANLSDETMKKNVVDCESIIEKFKQWKLRKFNYNSEADGTPLTYGVIAQEVESIHSDLVNADFPVDDGVDEEGKEKVIMKKTVKDHQLMMLGFKALQEAIAKIEVLETKVAALEAG